MCVSVGYNVLGENIRHYRGCDLLVVVDVHLPEDVEEVGVRDEIVLSDGVDSPARPSQVPDDVLQQ